MSSSPERILFVTGKLAEPALRRVLTELAPKVGFEAEIAVMPITVAALLTTDWIRRHLTIPDSIQRIVLPGFCRGELDCFPASIAIERGPKDLRDLPEYFGKKLDPMMGYGQYDITILAEINHAPKLSFSDLLHRANHYRQSGADLIDLGCDPGSTWNEVGEAVRFLKENDFRVSVDSFHPQEVLSAIQAGAELVLSVNSSNVQQAITWKQLNQQIEVVAIPDTPMDIDSLMRTVEILHKEQIRFRIDPILEPIGFGFAQSLGRYLEVRKRFPDAEMMMGIGNLTELTDADSAGINVLLAGFCQEQGIRSVLTTEVINWARSSVKEFDLARRLVYHAIQEKVLPKRLEPNLILLRDPKLYTMGPEGLNDLARQITDRNYRIFAERGEIHVMNGSTYVHGTDPFDLFEQLQKQDPKLDASHSFYLGYEMAKAVTALTLHKNYTQDQALRWGFLTVPEVSHR